MTKYRADIDGLRAISVIGVMLFHSGFGAPGGFVGVDVFFVISGYLIGGLIANQLDSASFSLQVFWERRIRRIWPAALVVTTATLAAGWFVFLPNDFRALAGDAIAQIVMAANVRYLDSSDYFAPASDLRPLRHTWSLAVEEQFYVLFPLVMMGLWKVPRRWRVFCLSLVTASSFAASVVTLRFAPSAAFYLLPFRAWEILLGSLLAIVAYHHPRRRSLREVLGVIGLLCIFVPMGIYTRSTPFPGAAALPACVGACLVIYTGTDEPTLTSRLLASAPLRLVGLLSYSLYLWHWPILAFLRYVTGFELSLPIVVAAYALTCCLAAASWRFIEAPFRNRGRDLKFLQVAGCAAATSGALLIASLIIRENDGFATRFPPDVSTFGLQPAMATASSRADHPDQLIPNLETLGSLHVADKEPCLFLWGDSHGLAIRTTLDRLASNAGISGFALLQHGAIPLPGVWRPGDLGGEKSRTQAITTGNNVLQWIDSNRPRNVMLCGRWSRYLEGGLADNGQEFQIASVDDAASLGSDVRTAVIAFQRGVRTIASHCAAVGARLWILLEVPYQPVTPRERSLRAALTGKPVALDGVTLEEHRAYQKTATDSLSGLSDIDIHVVDLAAPFFDAHGVSYVGRNGLCWYRDDDHINDRGASEALAETLSALIATMAESCGPNGRAGSQRSSYSDYRNRGRKLVEP